MNYIAQLKGFRKARLIKPLSANSICLYFILLEYVNEINFLPWFTVANSTLTGLSKLSDSALKRSRNELVQKGFIQYKNGRGSQSGCYHIVNLCANFDPQTDPQCGRQSEPQMSHNPDYNVDPLYKRNETKQNENNLPPLYPQGGEGEEEKKPSADKPKKAKKEYPALEEQIAAFTHDETLQTALEQFVEARKKMKKPLTGYAFYCLLIDLRRLEKKGYDSLDMVNLAISRGWQGFYEPYETKAEKKCQAEKKRSGTDYSLIYQKGNMSSG